VRLAAAVLAAVALAGCAGGGNDGTSAPSGDPAELLARAADRLREQASFGFESTYTRTRADEPDEPAQYGEADGALDLAAKRGRMTIDLDLGLAELDDPIPLRWNASELEVEFGGETRRLSRDEARAIGGQLGRVPDEPEALVEVLGQGRDARFGGEEEIDGKQTTRVAFTSPTRGASAEAAVGGPIGPRMPAEVWIGDEGLLRRLSYTLRFPATKALPARTVTSVYDLDDFGEPVSGLEFESQAG
jgi:LppX_LprAFG lipoprotein